ncbi:MAG: acyltransferase [Prevotella sp.]|nr:acyltransferase [Prevotella sp.]
MSGTVRDSNMELLRITAMFLVIIFHVDFISFDFPDDQLSIHTDSVSAFLKIWMCNATFTCVDVFVLLSGWYGIHPKAKRLAEFLFQVFFYSLLSYALFLAFDDNVDFSWHFLVHIFVTDDYWFVPIYLSLYLFSPVLNAFAEHASRRQFLLVICAAMLLQSVYGWMSPTESGYMEGRSPFSFFLLYLLARYIHLYADRLRAMSRRQMVLSFTIINTLATIIVFLAYYHAQQAVINTMFKFSSPFTIASSVLIVLFFLTLRLKSKAVNWVAASCFAVFLIHCFPYFNMEIYHPVIKYFYLHYDGLAFALLTSLFILTVYSGSILIDKARIAIWKRLSRHAGI